MDISEIKDITIINSNFAFAGFTSGNEGIWSRNEASDPPTKDYASLAEKLGIPLTKVIRPYQAGGDKVEIVGSEHGGSGVIKDNELKKVDGLVTAEKGLVLSVIAADCVPLYLIDKKDGVTGILHCGWKSAAGTLVYNAVRKIQELGASPADIKVIIGPHICEECYEVGEEVRNEYANSFTETELENIFSTRNKRLYLDLSEAIRIKFAAEGIISRNISDARDCTFHNSSLYSYRRGDRGKQNLAYIMMKTEK
jgi:hypothetical protein